MSVVTSRLESKETWTTKPSPKGRDVKIQRRKHCLRVTVAWRGSFPCKSAAAALQKCDSVMSPSWQHCPCFQIASFKISSCPAHWCAVGPRGCSLCMVPHTAHSALLAGLREGSSIQETKCWDLLLVLKVSSLLCLGRTEHLSAGKTWRRNDVGLWRKLWSGQWPF